MLFRTTAQKWNPENQDWTVIKGTIKRYPRNSSKEGIKKIVDKIVDDMLGLMPDFEIEVERIVN